MKSIIVLALALSVLAPNYVFAGGLDEPSEVPVPAPCPLCEPDELPPHPPCPLCEPSEL